MKLLAPLALVGSVAAAGWFYLTPHFALMRLQSAAESGDTRALREMVDFPAVRQSLKDEARITVADELRGRGAGGSLASLGGLVAGVVTDRLVDAAVQPEGIAALTRGTRPGDRGEAGARPRAEAPELDVKRGYEGADRYVVSFHDPASGRQRVALVMRRDGLLDWKLAAVRLGDE